MNKRKVKGIRRRALAVIMSALMVSSSVDTSGFGLLSADAAENREEIRITAIAEPEESILQQNLAVGAQESEICFPDSLTVTVEKDTVAGTEEPADTEDAGGEVGDADTEDAGEEAGDADTEDAGEEAGDADTENAAGQAPADIIPENGLEPQSMPIAIQSVNMQSTSDAAQGTEAQSASASTGVTAEERTLTDITWVLDAEESDSDVFDSSIEGSCYVYAPVLPQTDEDGNAYVLAEGVEAPRIYVLVGEPGIALLNSGEYGTVLESGATGDCTYTIYDTDGNDGKGDLVVISGTGAMGSYSYEAVAPWMTDTYRDTLKKIIVEYGVTYIGTLTATGYDANKYQFLGSANALEVEIKLNEEGKSTLTMLEREAFYCSNLASINLPEGLETIGIGAFQGSTLGRVIVPSTVTLIGSKALRDATAYYLCWGTANIQGYNAANSMITITKEVDGVSAGTRYVLPADVAAGTVYAGTKWDAAAGFPSAEVEDENYTWQDADGNSYTVDDPATPTKNTTFRRYTYEARTVLFDLKHVTTSGKTDGSEVAKAGESGEDYTCELTANDRYYPLTIDDISVKVGEENLSAESYSYEDGKLTIQKEALTDTITITACARVDESKCEAAIIKNGSTTYYPDLDDAMAAVIASSKEDSCVLHILKDCSLDTAGEETTYSYGYYRQINTNVIMDLDGHTITMKWGTRLYFGAGASAIIRNGKISAETGESTAAIYQYDGELTLEKLDLEGTHQSLSVRNSGKLTIRGGSYRSGEGDEYAVEIYNQALIEGATFYGNVWGGPSTRIASGTFGGTLTIKNANGIDNLNDLIMEGSAVRKIEDGSYYTREELAGLSAVTGVEVLPCPEHSVKDSICQRCGTEVSSHAGAHRFDEKTGICTYSGCGVSRLGMIELNGTQTFYKSWDALRSAMDSFTESSNATVRIYRNVTTSSPIEFNVGTIRFDLNGYTLKMTEGEWADLISIGGSADVTLDNGTIINGLQGAICINGGSFTAGPGLIVNSSSWVYYAGISCDSGRVTINGGSYSGNFNPLLQQVDVMDITINGGKFAGTIKIGAGAKLSGGTYSDIIIWSPHTPETVLADGYAFRSTEEGNAWQPEGMDDGNGNLKLSNVSVEQIPVRITQQPQDRSVYRGDAETLSLTAEALNGAPITYEWYCVGTGEDGADEKLSATTDSLSLPTDLEVGKTYQYYCVAACEGYQLKSDIAEVSVHERIQNELDPADIIFDPSYRNGYAYYLSDGVFAYGGGAEVCPTVTLKDSALVEDKDYEIVYRDNQDVGTATVVIKGIGNYDGMVYKSFEIVIPEYTGRVSVDDGGAGITMLAGEDGVYITPAYYIRSSDVKINFSDADAVTLDYTDNSSWENGSCMFNAPEGTDGAVTRTIYARIDSGENQGYYQAAVRVDFDRTGPVFGEDGGISVREYRWNTMLDAITFGVLGNVRTEVTIHATDELSGVSLYAYYVETVPEDGKDSYRILTAAELDTKHFQEAEYGSFILNEGGNHVIYAYAMDSAGNYSDYICSDGVVIDDVAPVLTVTVPEGERLADTTAEVLFTCSEAGSYDYLVSPQELTLSDLKALRENAAYSSANTGTFTQAQAGSGIRVNLSGLSANTKYYFYIAATDLVGNEGAVESISFTTDRTHPYIAAAPVVSGIYGTRVEDMTVTGGEVRTKQGGDVLAGIWEILDENGSDIPAVGGSTAYAVRFTPDDDAYGQVFVRVVPRVSKKAVTVVIMDWNRPYGQENPEFTWMLKAGMSLAEGDDEENLGITLSTTAGNTSGVKEGGYPITGTSDSANYQVTFEGLSAEGHGILTITQARNSFTDALTCEDYTYTGTQTPSPSAAAKFGAVTYRYAKKTGEGEPGEDDYTAKAPTDAGTYLVKAYVEETINYTGLVSDAVEFTIHRAERVPNTPSGELRAESRYGKIGNVPLPAGWSWQEEERDTELVVGETVSATAVYLGADQDNYEQTSILISVTCYKCTHEKTEVRYVTGADCEHTGYSGDTYCTECALKLSSGSTTAALGHRYTSAVTKEPTTTEAGIRTYTCTRCHESYTEKIDKLPADPSQDGQGAGTDPSQGGQGAGTEAGQDGQPDAPEAGQTNGQGGSTGGNNDRDGGRNNQDSDRNGQGTGRDGNRADGTGAGQDGTGAGQDGSGQEPDGTDGTGRPFISGDSDRSGWDLILTDVEQAQEGDTIRVDMNGSTVVPAEIFGMLQGVDAQIIFDMGDGITWTVNGMDITEPVGNIDFGVKTGADAGDTIPVEVINRVTGERYYMNMSLSHEGEFGFTAVLCLTMDGADAGLYANLFYYNEQTGELEFICADRIAEDGSVKLTFTHASEYTVVIDEVSMEDMASAGDDADGTDTDAAAADGDASADGTAVTDPENGAGAYWWIVLIAAALAVVIVLLLVLRKKRDKQ